PSCCTARKRWTASSPRASPEASYGDRHAAGTVSDSWMQTNGAVLLACYRCSLVRLRVTGLRWRHALSLLYSAAVGPSAWESDCHASLTIAPQVGRHLRLSVATRQVPLFTLVPGMQRARFHVGGKLFDRFLIREVRQAIVLSHLLFHTHII